MESLTRFRDSWMNLNDLCGARKNLLRTTSSASGVDEGYYEVTHDGDAKAGYEKQEKWFFHLIVLLLEERFRSSIV